MGKLIQMHRGRDRSNMKNELLNKIKKSNLNIKNMEEISNVLIEHYRVTSFPIPIIEIMKDMGFNIYKHELENNLSGYIAINDELKSVIGTSKIVCVNEQDNVGHQRFTVAHELAHYLFDYKENEPYFNTYKTTENSTNKSEIRANKFAANLLMPKNLFIDEYNNIKNRDINMLAYLADRFKVSSKAIEKRMEELKLAYKC